MKKLLRLLLFSQELVAEVYYKKFGLNQRGVEMENLSVIHQQKHQHTESVLLCSRFFSPADVFFFVCECSFIFEISIYSTWQSVFICVQVADLESLPQKCKDNIHSHMHENVNSYKYWSCVWPMSQKGCHIWLTLWERCYKSIIIMFCLNQAEWVDLSLWTTERMVQPPDMGIYSHYWYDCWHVLLNTTRTNHALMWGTNEDEQMRVPDGDSLSLFYNYGLSFFTPADCGIFFLFFYSSFFSSSR